MTGDKNLKKGFTILELVIVMAIFTVSAVSLGSAFLFTQKTQRGAGAKLTVNSEARFAFEAVAREIRRGTIDYSGYGGTISPVSQSELKLKDPSNRAIVFKRNSAGGIGAIQVSVDGGATWSDLTSGNVDAQVLNFYIVPSTDPFAQSPASNEQPRVTIAAVFKSLEKGAPQVPTVISTTVSSRFYGR